MLVMNDKGMQNLLSSKFKLRSRRLGCRGASWPVRRKLNTDWKDAG